MCFDTINWYCPPTNYTTGVGKSQMQRTVVFVFVTFITKNNNQALEDEEYAVLKALGEGSGYFFKNGSALLSMEGVVLHNFCHFSPRPHMHCSALERHCLQMIWLILNSISLKK